jgi:hypothetical protein
MTAEFEKDARDAAMIHLEANLLSGTRRRGRRVDVFGPAEEKEATSSIGNPLSESRDARGDGECRGAQDQPSSFSLARFVGAEAQTCRCAGAGRKNC